MALPAFFPFPEKSAILGAGPDRRWKPTPQGEKTMRKAITLAVALCAFCAAGLFADLAPGKTAYVKSQSASLRSGPSFTAKILATLKYGRDSVLVYELKGNWIRVQVAGSKAEGWMAKSDLNDKKLVLASGVATKTGASQEEINAAGKGFNKEIEAQYRASGKVDYSWVEAMEKFRVSTEAAMAFRAAGGLPEGGAE
jgi:hypothetical protein